METRERVELQLLLLSFQILALPLMVQSIAALGFAAGVPLNWWHLPAALALTLVGANFWHRRVWPLRGAGDALAVNLVFLATLAVGTALAVVLPAKAGADASLLRIDALIHGLNPLRESMGAGNGVNGLGSRIFQAAVALAGGDIKGGRTLHVLLLLASWASGWALVRRLDISPLALRAVFVVLILANPVAVCALTDFGAASSAASVLTVSWCLSALWLRIGRTWLLPIVAAGWSLLPTFGADYLPMAFVGIFGTILLTRWRRPEFTGSAAAWLLVGGLLGFVLGMQPLLGPTPMVQSWSQALGLTHGNTPAISPDFAAHGRVERLAVSLFAESRDGCQELPGLSEPVCAPKLKIPGLIRETELFSFIGQIPRYGGFGPLFGAGLAVALLAFLVLLLDLELSVIRWSLTGLVFLIGQTLIAADAWWAPAGPQVWLLPLLFLAPLWMRSTGAGVVRGLARCVGVIALFLLLCDALLVCLPGLVVSSAQLVARF